jgi:energy-coupling factor transporter ATP-binding protein EcfA2
MDISYRLRNFAAFADSGNINLAPITVLCGENSSGKSSLLKSLLLIKQSAANRRSGFDFSDTQPLLMNGEFTRLGSWTDLVHGKDRDTRITFEWNISGNVDATQGHRRYYQPHFGSFHPTRHTTGPFHHYISITLASREYQNLEYSAYVQ